MNSEWLRFLHPFVSSWSFLVQLGLEVQAAAECRLAFQADPAQEVAMRCEWLSLLHPFASSRTFLAQLGLEAQATLHG